MILPAMPETRFGHNQIDPTKPTIFLSSTFAHDWLGERRVATKQLRKRLTDSAPGVNVWAYEALFDQDERAPGPQILDRCVEGVEASDLFVFLLTGRHGSGMDLGANRAAVVSYLEAELFTAAAARKPIAVLILRGAEPEPELRNVLDILRSAFPAKAFFTGDEEELLSRWRELAISLRRKKLSIFTKLSRLVDSLSFARAQGGWREDLANPELRFLDGRLSSGRGEPNLPLVHALLDQVAGGVTSMGEPLKYPARLTRLWTALRELGQAGEAAAFGADLAPLWDRALGLWGGVASWFGLHGHLQLSPLAAINTQLTIRSRAARNIEDSDSERSPVGARASALYSLALRAGRRRGYHLQQTVALTTQAMERRLETEGGLLAIRGAAHMRLRHFLRAETDFRQSLAWRERHGVNNFSVGDAMVDLAFARAFTRPLFGDLPLLEGGLRMMQDGPPGPNDRAFLARAYRKAAIAYSMAGRFGRAREAWQRAQCNAIGSGALDQKDRFG